MNLESANLFAALDTKKKKKGKSSKDHDKKKKPDKAEKAAELDRAVFAQQVPASTNWADEDDDDDFDNDLGPLPESWAQVHAVTRRDAVRLCFSDSANAEQAQNAQQTEAADEDAADSDEVPVLADICCLHAFVYHSLTFCALCRRLTNKQ